MKKLFNLSLHRSGTQSFCALFHEAGCRVKHFPGRKMESDCRSLLSDFNEEKLYECFEDIIREADVFADIPYPVLAETLMTRHATENFVLILREPKAWVKSVREHTKGRTLGAFEKMQYWGITRRFISDLNDLSDADLIRAYHFHTGKIVSYATENEIRLSVLELGHPQLAKRLQQFSGITLNTNFPLVDYKKGTRWRLFSSSSQNSMEVKED